MSLWEFVGYLLWGALIVSYLLALLHVLRDLFRSSLSGWMKAVWVVLLFILPLVSLLIWLIVGGFADKTAEDARYAGAPAADGSKSPAQQIADAQALVDAGTISGEEFLRLKGLALK
ncbi:PLDc N-terminal domain-containing protein [Microbacterium sp. H1-D42]|uniref:PLDc N-terminal domain-containing protein n=1 Tax=Microbacterium sp. H1-D42 TaxID=2925844 RepID=UPI001F53154E|nr:PLDc N-terminal domain-containing protein [Microbacterium sp. H1-D42]UNK71101.1 PLDc N-terminal domain-containing protein [Microbacterium sp. H1-D42]